MLHIRPRGTDPKNPQPRKTQRPRDVRRQRATVSGPAEGGWDGVIDPRYEAQRYSAVEKVRNYLDPGISRL